MNFLQEVQNLIKNELDFCKESEFEATDNGNYIYKSINGASSFNLPHILKEYKEWLIKKKVVKEI